MLVLICWSILIRTLSTQNSSKPNLGVNVGMLRVSENSFKSTELTCRSYLVLKCRFFHFFINSHVTSSGVEL